MEGKASEDLNPSWQAAAAAIANERETALRLDATAATHPIIRHVETVDQIGQAFDDITYAKGQAVIGMLESTLGPARFRDGIRRYMAKYKGGNTVTDQLWAELSAAAGRPVEAIAHDFTLQGGVPLVRVAGARCARGMTVMNVAQERFGLDQPSKAPQRWRVPLVAGTLGGASTSAVVSGPSTPILLKGCGTLVLNQGKGSYARVLYDDATHAAIVRDYQRLALTDRLGTLGDDFALAAGGYQDLSRWFALAGQVGATASPLEWDTLDTAVGRLVGIYRGTPLEAPLRARRAALLGPELRRIGLAARAGESVLVTNLRESLLETVGTGGDAEVTALARRYVAALGTDPTAVPPAIRQPILTTFAFNASPADWDQLLALTEAEKSPVAKNRFVALLGVARDEVVARRALALLLTERITPPQKASLLRAIANVHPDLAFDWAVAHREAVESWLEQSTRAQYIVGLGGGSSDPAMPGKITAFADKYLPEAARDSARRTIAGIAVCKATADRLRAATARWLGVPG